MQLRSYQQLLIVTYLVCHLPKTIAQQCHIDAGFPKTPHPRWLWVVLWMEPCVLLLVLSPSLSKHVSNGTAQGPHGELAAEVLVRTNMQGARGQ